MLNIFPKRALCSAVTFKALLPLTERDVLHAL